MIERELKFNLKDFRIAKIYRKIPGGAEKKRNGKPAFRQNVTGR
jgi:hypothetical protein